jgi:beta-galactosidase
MGHINFGHQIETDHKGLIEFKDVEGKLKLQWNHYKIPITNDMLNWTKIDTKKTSPRFYRYNLTLQEIGDTYLNMANWKKGYVFVNGINIGRYWNRGPQQKVFVPGVWLKKGANDIVVFDLLIDSAKFIKGEKNLLLEHDKIFNKTHKPSVQHEIRFV